QASFFASRHFPLSRRALFRGGLVAVAIALTATISGVTWAGDERDDRSEPGWVGTWGASPQQPATIFGTAPSFTNQTVREIVRISAGGSQLRVRLSNLYGTQSLVIGAAHVAVSAGAAAIRPATDRALTFSGHSSIVVPPGAPVLSDPVDLN